MSILRTVEESINQSLGQMADGEAALRAAGTAHDMYTDRVSLLAEQVQSLDDTLHHTADTLARTEVYIDSTVGKFVAAATILDGVAHGTQSSNLAQVTVLANTARGHVDGPNESARSCVQHANLRLHTISELLGALTREVTALQAETVHTTIHIQEGTTAARTVITNGSQYLTTLGGGSNLR